MGTRITAEGIKNALANEEANVSHAQILRSMGMSAGPNNYKVLSRVASENGIVLPPKHPSGRKGIREQGETGRAWDEGLLRKAASESKSISELCIKMGYSPNGAAVGFRVVKKALEEYEVPFEISRGSKPDPRLAERILVIGSRRVPGRQLKDLLYRDNLKKEECEECGAGPVWNGKPLVLQIDHKNGTSHDNRLENLRILCPNCHSQTDNFAGKNARRGGDKGGPQLDN